MPGVAWREEPHVEVERDGVRYTLLGTAHVSPASVAAVRAAIDSGLFDAVAVELDAQRLQALTDPDALAKLDLVRVIRDNKVAMFAANLGLAAYQRRLAEQLGIEPGAELKAAVREAEARTLPVHLVDRDIGLTLKRAMQRLGWFDRLKIGTGIVTSLFVDEDVSEEQIEGLKEGDMLESSFGGFAKDAPTLYSVLIDERDQYMAARLRESGTGATHVLAVVGAGHLKGLSRALAGETRPAAEIVESLAQIDTRRRIPWITLGLTALILGGIGWGFTHGGAQFGAQLVLLWAAWTAGLAAAGCLIAAGHPLSVLMAAVVAPFKPFRPGMPAGMFSALSELRLRKPTYGDFMALRDDAQTLRGWYHNRVCRVVLVFMLTNLGMMAGEWIAIASGARKLLH